MVAIPRAAARSCRAVFRRLSAGRGPRGRPAAVGLTSGPDGLRVRFAAQDAAAEYLHPSAGEEARLTVPLEALAACEGRRDDAVFRPLEGGRVEVAWQEAGEAHVRAFPCEGLDAPEFPAWPESDAANAPRLLTALERAMQTTAKESLRYALHRVLLRGRKGEVVATDGTQLLIQGGFAFPWEGDLLVPRVGVFAAPELVGGAAVRVGLSAGHVLVRAGGWTVALKVVEGERYPHVEAAIPLAGKATVWRPGAGEVGALARLLPTLPGGGKEPTAVTVDLGRGVAVRARAEGDTRSAEAALPRSSVDGGPVRFAVDRALLARACALGFTSLAVGAGGGPAVCRGGPTTFVCVTRDAKEALPPHPFPVRVSLDGTTLPDGASLKGGRRRRPPAVETQPHRKAGAAVSVGGLPGLFSLWSRAFGRLAGLVTDQRRRERCG